MGNNCLSKGHEDKILCSYEHNSTGSSNLLLINYHGVATSKWKKDGAKKEKIINSSHLWIAMQNPNLNVGT